MVYLDVYAKEYFQILGHLSKSMNFTYTLVRKIEKKINPSIPLIFLSISLGR